MVLEFCRDNSNSYTCDYLINGKTIKIKVSKQQNDAIVNVSNTLSPMEDYVLSLDKYVKDENNTRCYQHLEKFDNFLKDFFNALRLANTPPNPVTNISTSASSAGLGAHSQPRPPPPLDE